MLKSLFNAQNRVGYNLNMVADRLNALPPAPERTPAQKRQAKRDRRRYSELLWDINGVQARIEENWDYSEHPDFP